MMFQIRACASLNATFSLDRTEMAEEEEKKSVWQK